MRAKILIISFVIETVHPGSNILSDQTTCALILPLNLNLDQYVTCDVS